MLTDGDKSGLMLNNYAVRQKQLDRWVNSDTDREPGYKKDINTKVQFDKGIAFLAASSQCDRQEVKELLRQGVDPNSVNCDGLTALHQACIDDNISMVEFLVKNGSKVNVPDNEGWTPLHATASCGYIDIASYLIKQGADVAACNSDGDLALDIAEGSDMENLLASVMNSQNINAYEARCAEAITMLNDAKEWQMHPERPELEDVKTGATALHVAAAKGYHNVMMALIEAGADINHQDFDGWTPLHGAAHWGQEDSCKVLVEALCDMDLRDKHGKTAAEQADESLVKLMAELYEKQKSLRSVEKKDSFDDMVMKPRAQIVRRTSVTRMSNEDKEKLAHVASLEERGTVLAAKNKISEELDTEESHRSQSKLLEDQKTQETPKSSVKSPEVQKSSQSDKPLSTREVKPSTPVAVVPPSTSTTTSSSSDSKEQADQYNELLVFRRSSSSDYDINTAGSPASPGPTSWRAGLRKTGSTSAVFDNNATDRKLTSAAAAAVVKSSSASVISSNDTSPVATGTSSTTSTAGAMMRDKRPFAALRDQSSSDRSSYPLVGRSNYVPYYRRQQMEREAKMKEEKEAANSPAPTVSGSSSSPSNDSLVTSSPLAKSESESEKTPDRRVSRFEAPKRDEEAETNRKKKAKRARETRRSTQGVTQDDVKAAEATLKSADTNGMAAQDASSKSRPDATTSSQSESSVSQETRPEEPNRRRTWQRDEGTRSSFRKARDTIISANNSSSSIPDTLASSAPRYSRNSAEITEDRPERQRYSWRNSDRNGVERKEGVEDSKQKEDDESGERNKSRNLRSRRNRRERRSTGVIHFDENDLDKNDDDKDCDTSEAANNDDTSSASTDSSNVLTTGWNSSRPFTSRRYGSASDVPSQMSSGGTGDKGDRSSYTGRYRRPPSTGTALEPNSDVDYKKLFEECKTENEKLKSQVKSLQSELETARSSSSISRSRGGSTTESLSEKREKRALERRVSELEEEIKKMELVKQDNTRLKEENGALIRVISKLSK